MNDIVTLFGKVNGVEIQFIYYPEFGYFEGIFPRQFSDTYIIELWATDLAGNETYVATVEIQDGRVVNPSVLVNVLFSLGLVSKRTL